MPTLSRLALCALLAYAAPTLAQTVTRNIPYTTDSTGSYRADLYEPPGTGPFPAVVMIHGGSWRSGSKGEMRKLSRDLAAHGFACFSINYDLHARSFPYSWQESRAAVAFLRAHAQDDHIDPARIAVLGTSAGGQLAALVALAPDGPAAGDLRQRPASAPEPEPVAAAVALNGGYDLHPNAYVLRRYFGGRCHALPGACDDASPDNHIHPGAPPFFVGHGNHDHLIPYSQATHFIALLRAAGDSVTPFVATGAGHSYWKKRRWYQKNLAAVEQFLDTALGSAATRP